MSGPVLRLDKQGGCGMSEYGLVGASIKRRSNIVLYILLAVVAITCLFGVADCESDRLAYRPGVTLGGK